jgi:rhamnosyltransferase
MAEVSIIIPVKNGGGDLLRCLGTIAEQAFDREVEVVVVDSASVDGSAAAARAWGARVLQIPPEQFNHGATRNLGAKAAEGELLVFLSQDAEPVGPDWLADLVAPLDADKRIAGAYGRQVARSNAVPPEEFFLDFVYGPKARRRELGPGGEHAMETTMFSNVNSAIRREAWEQHPFADDLIMSEDQDWSRRALGAGWSIVYEPRAVVRHSHPYRVRDAFRRFFDSGVSSERAYLAGDRAASRVLRRTAARYVVEELAWLVRTGNVRWIPYALLYEGAKLAGLVLGTHHRHLPIALKRRLSAMGSYWDSPAGGGTGTA